MTPIFAKVLGPDVQVMDQNKIVSDGLVNYLERHPRFESQGTSLAFTNGDAKLANQITERFKLRVPRFQAL